MGRAHNGSYKGAHATAQSMKQVIGLDIGTRTGWSYFENGILRDSGTIVLRAEQGPARRSELYIAVRHLVASKFDKDTCILAIEEVKFSKFMLAYGSFRANKAIIELVADQSVCSFLEVPTGTLKKFATGNGHASKEDMIRAANLQHGTKLPIAKKSEDEADAIHVGAWASQSKKDQNEKPKKSTTGKRSTVGVRNVKPSRGKRGARARSRKRRA